MDDALLLAMLTSCCAIAEGALIEREPQTAVFDGLLHLLARLPSGHAMMADLIRWELTLLAALGFGLDLSVCAATGETEGLRLVSPRTGRAVSDAAAGIWRDRLLPLPAFLTQVVGGDTAPATTQDWADGLRLSGHFLERDAFGAHHRPLPQARRALADRVEARVLNERETGVHE
jgi:DNA repair protein RecO (recombination protein O)